MMQECKRVPYPDHPDRCQANAGNERDQCWFFKEPDSNYCIMHGGKAGTLAAEKKSFNLYRIGKFEQRLREFQTANGARTIDEELALLRMMLEEVINKCDGGGMELLLYSTKIMELIREIRTTVVAADKLATKAGMLIGRAEAIVIAGKVVDAISKHITDPNQLSKIGDEIATIFITPSALEE